MPSAGDTIAEGIAVKKPAALTASIIRRLVDEILLVSENEIETAVGLFLQIEKTVAEGAGAAGLAAVLAHRERFEGRKIGLVLTGGNIDTRLLATVLLRDLYRSGRMSRLRIQLQDRPGALYSVVRLFGWHNVNILEIAHQRIFTALPAKDAFIDIDCEARDASHLKALAADLERDGFRVHPVEIR
jgi:threonine dehydratase